MRVNVCVNGTFRYPDYIRFYQEAGILNRFYFAHRRSRTGPMLGLPADRTRNIWPKHYASAAAFRCAPSRVSDAIAIALCDGWQQAVVRQWQPCDTLEAVIGAVADRVIAHARRDGTKILGHPVTTHPVTSRRLIDRSRETLGLAPGRFAPDDHDRRLTEITACDALVADSAFVARSFIDNGVPAERIAVVQPGIDLDRFHPRTSDEVDRSRFLVVCVGIITPRKAQHLLLRAWRRLKLPNAALLLVGALGRDASAVLDGHHGSFTHVPHVAHDALRSLLARASCFVLTSAEDGFAQAPFEAMACGVPTILSENVGAAGLIHNGFNGFVVPSFDVDAIAAMLERLYRDRDLGDCVGQAAATSIQAGGSWSDYAGNVIALHRRLFAGAALAERVAA